MWRYAAVVFAWAASYGFASAQQAVVRDLCSQVAPIPHAAPIAVYVPAVANIEIAKVDVAKPEVATVEVDRPEVAKAGNRSNRGRTYRNRYDWRLSYAESNWRSLQSRNNRANPSSIRGQPRSCRRRHTATNGFQCYFI